MTDSPAHLLFEKEYHGRKLFNSQQDLVKELLENSSSKFYVSSNKEDYLRRFISLKSFLSQLLSGRSRRVITDEFIQSLLVILKSKNGIENEVEEIHDQIIRSLKSVRFVPGRKPSLAINDNKKERLLKEFKIANYIVLISVSPFELQNELNSFLQTLRNEIINSLVSNLIDKPTFKKFRYNVPSNEVAILLWRRIYTLLYKALIEKYESSILKEAFIKYQLNVSDANEDEQILFRLYTANYLKKINEEGIIGVFNTSSPIFVLPQIFFNPNDYTNTKGYFYFTTPDENVNVHELSEGEIFSWRQFVWFRLKEKILGEAVLFETNFTKIYF